MSLRVGTYQTHQMFVSQVTSIQKRLADYQMQISSGVKSQDYAGLGVDSQRLVNLENERSKIQRYIKDNKIADVRLRTQETAVNAIDGTIRAIRDRLIETNVDLTNGVTADEQRQIDTLQSAAFQAMKDIESYLNTKVDGYYLFAGGRVDQEPVQLGFTSLEAFQAVYDGTTQTYPADAANHLNPTAPYDAYHTSYYKGDSLEVTHRVDENRSITLGINAADPAFEKALRAIGIIAQGGLDDPANASRYTDALNLLNDALNHDPNNSSEDASDIDGLIARIGDNRVVLDQARKRLEDDDVYLGNKAQELEGVDEVEVVTKMNFELQALQVSFESIARVQQMSLADYL